MTPRHTPHKARIDDAITYLVQQYTQDTIFTRTKLVKLLYLADKQYRENNPYSITGVAWSKYHYGPYDETIIERVKTLDNDRIRIVEHVRDTGIQYHHRPSGTSEEYPNLSTEMKRTLDTVLDTYAAMDTTDLVKHICNTPPVETTAKYAPITLTN